MSTAPHLEPTATVDEIRPLRQLRAFTLWVGAGRPLTQTGRVRLTDARELVAMLDTGDVLDPMGGGFKTTSSAELLELTLIVEWAKACRLVRVQRGRLERVKKHAGLLDRPAELWERMFDVFGQLGDAICPDGWAESLLRHHFRATIDAVLLETYRRGGTIATSDAHALAWETVAARFFLCVHDAPGQHLKTWRATTDRDLRCALHVLQRLGSVDLHGDTVSLTERGLHAMRRASGDATPGDAVLQLKISLLGISDPPVWRRLLVPAAIKLDRLHDLIQAAIGWHDGHLHAFSAGGVDYGIPDPELGHRDERRTPLRRLLAKRGDRVRYTYDFGDDWEHEIVVEKVLAAEPGARYPVCIGGRGACPPEDCGGTWGYAELRATLADPDHAEEHDQMLEWLGLERADEFDATAFDIDAVNEAL